MQQGRAAIVDPQAQETHRGWWGRICRVVQEASATAGVIGQGWWGRPPELRRWYRAWWRQAPGRLLQIGVAYPQQIARLLRWAARRRLVAVCAIDWFETRSHRLPPLALKSLYRLLAPATRSVRLLPGPVKEALQGWSWHVGTCDWVLVDELIMGPLTQEEWQLLRRVTHPDSLLWRRCRREDGRVVLETLVRDQLPQQPARHSSRAA